jgi:hypothetical protein
MDKHDRQISLLVGRVNEGESPDIIAFQEGIKLQSLYQRFRRAGYNWDECLRKYIKRSNVNHQNISSRLLPERAAQVIIQCRGVKADRKATAIRLGFGTVEEMDYFMNQFEFEWWGKEHTYKAMN